MKHVNELYQWMHRDTKLLDDEEKVKLGLAILFHDFVYEVQPRGKSNEELSRLEFEMFAEEFGIKKSHTEFISRVILATEDPIAPEWRSESFPFQRFLDWDLAVLGSENYKDYARAIQQEHSILPRHSFHSKRVNWIEYLMKNNLGLYHTKEMKELLQRKAYDNLFNEYKAIYRKVIGLHGGIASGKSSVRKYFQNKQIHGVDADEVAHGLYRKGKRCFSLLVDEFGSEIVTADGKSIDRKKLAEIVFKNPKKKKLVESIVWPEVSSAIRFQVESPGIHLVESALLVESGLDKICDEIWCTSSEPEISINRLKERNLSESEAFERLQSQSSNEFREENSQIIIKTNGSLPNLHHVLNDIWKNHCNFGKPFFGLLPLIDPKSSSNPSLIHQQNLSALQNVALNVQNGLKVIFLCRNPKNIDLYYISSYYQLISELHCALDLDFEIIFPSTKAKDLNQQLDDMLTCLDLRHSPLQFFMSNHCQLDLSVHGEVVEVPVVDSIDQETDDRSTIEIPNHSHHYLAIGGSFDHLHSGHKLMLSFAGLHVKQTNGKILIGITSHELLKNKSFKEYIQPFEVRKDKVLAFLRRAFPQANFSLEFFELHDHVGESGNIPNLDGLVVSTETLDGGHLVNQVRTQKGLDSLSLIVCPKIGKHEEKLSSTQLRERIHAPKPSIYVVP